MRTRQVAVRSVLTRVSGYLETVCSHSLQPYRGCPFGKSLCGVGCYVRHNIFATKGEPWGSTLDVRENAAEVYAATFAREQSWARRRRGRFSVFLSSATEPFPPQEARYGVTRRVLGAMIERPPDALIVQTHSQRVADHADVLRALAEACDLRVHISIETDRERLPGLPPPASTVARRFEAAEALKRAGLFVVVTVAPLGPIADPEGFFARIARSADAVILDHFIGGDGSSDGSRTRKTALPAAMAAVDPASTGLAYLREMAAVARSHLPGRVGLHRDGFAGRWDA